MTNLRNLTAKRQIMYSLGMGRARGRTDSEALAVAGVALRSASPDDKEALAAAVREAREEIERALAEHHPHYSKTEAAELLEVSVPTLDKWIVQGLLPTEEVEEYKRPRVPAEPLLTLAGEVKELRRLGHKQGLLAEALLRLEQEDPEWAGEFNELYGPGLRAMQEDAQYVSAAPGPDWHPDD